MRDADVVVVGGSVAGATTAAFLARAGHRVIVVERARFPRDKPCGEGLMPHGIDVLTDLGLAEPVRAIARELHGVRYTVPSGASVYGRFPRPVDGGAATAFGVRRTALDALLLEHARDRGAEVVEQFRVRGLLRDRRGRVVGVAGDGGEISARVVVGADGLHSSVRGWLGWEAPRARPRRWAVRGHFQLAPQQSLSPEIVVVLAAGAEAYLTPLPNGEVLLALLGGRALMSGLKGGLTDGFTRAVSTFAPLNVLLDGAALLPGVRAIGPFAVRASRVAGNGALLVGDAAGFLDPITGEGMAAALQQARAAARVIDRALRDGSRDLTAYEHAHRRITRSGARLTWIALALCGSERLTAHALRGLQKRPGLFDKLLAINCGRASLSAITPREWVALTAGA
jgi:menaquinone-9 beta-reductase